MTRRTLQPPTFGRRDLLVGGARLSALAVVGGLSSACTDGAPKPPGTPGGPIADVAPTALPKNFTAEKSLNDALRMKYVLVELSRRAAAEKKLGLTASLREQLGLVRRQDEAHADELRALLTRRGDGAADPFKVKFSKETFAHWIYVVARLVDLKEPLASAWVGLLPLLPDDDQRTAVLRIGYEESQHIALLRDMRGASPVVGSPFQPPAYPGDTAKTYEDD